MSLSLYDIKNILNPKKYDMPIDDFRMLDSWAEYDESSNKPIDEKPLKYLCYEMEVVNPETGEKAHLYKAIKFARVIRLPKSAKQSTSLMDMHSQILAGVWEMGCNMITVIANIIEPVPLGLLFLYGVQGVSKNLEDAKAKADSDFLGLMGMLTGTYRVLELRITNAQETEWLREKMYGMEYMTVARGIPKASKSGEDGGNKGMGGKNINPDSQGTLEEIISGMADYEYVIEVLSTPVFMDTLKAWALRTERDMTDWNEQLQGTKSLSFNLSIPMMNMASLSNSQGYSKGYTESEGVSFSTGESFNTSYGQSVGESLSQTFGESFGQSMGQTVTDTVSQTHSISQGISIGESVGTTFGESFGMSNSVNASQGFGTNSSMSEGASVSHSSGQSFTESMGQTLGSSYSVNQGESVGTSHNVGNSQNIGWGTSQNISQGNSQSFGQSSNVTNGVTAGHTTGRTDGVSSSVGHNYGENYSSGKSTSENDTFNVGVNLKVLNISGGGGTTEGSSFSNGGSFGHSWSNGESHSMSQSNSISQSNSVSHGNSFTNGYSQSVSQGVNQSNSFGTSESFGTSHGQSLSQGWGASESQNQSQSLGTSVSDGWGSNIGYSTGASESYSLGQGASNSMSQSISNSRTQSMTQSQTESLGVSVGKSVGQSVSQSYSQSASESYGKTYGESQSVSSGKSQSQGETQGVSSSLGTTGGISSGLSGSMGIAPSIGYSKSYQWKDQQVQDILELLEFQNERLKRALRGNGAFYTYVYIACATMDGLSTAMALAKSTWQNEFAMTNPLQVLNLTEEEQKHLLYHFSAFSSDVTRENVAGVSEYKYATILLPSEYVAYTHLPRISEGGIFSEVNDIPKFSVPSMMKGEIFMGKILSAERYTMLNGYSTPFDYRIRESELMHGFFTGASRSGKTVCAMRFISELSRVRRKKTGKRLRIVAMDPKHDWRTLARFVEPERFRFYSLGNTHFRPINLNPCKIPKGVWPQFWIDGLIDIYCRAYGLLERGKQMLGETFYQLYEEAGVFEACNKPNWKEIVPELSSKVTFAKVYQRMHKIKVELEDPNNKNGRAGNDTRDAYARLLDRLQCFSREFSIERKLFSNDNGLGVDDLIGADDITVFESEGLESTFANFIFGIITSGFYKVAKSIENGYLNENQYETVLVIEEANKVLTGNDCAGTGGGNSFGMTGQSEFEEMLDQAAGYGLFIFAITQKIADMPSSIIANAGLVFSGRLVRQDDVTTVIRSISREERYEDRDILKWLPRSPIGWFICKSSRGFDFKDAEPVLVKISQLNIKPPSNKDIEEILIMRDAAIA